MSDASPDVRPSPEDSFHVLADHRRRLALAYLERADGAVSLGELSDAVADAERERAGDEAAVDGERVACALHHKHLPKLAEAGAVEYVGDRTVEATPVAAAILEQWDAVADAVDPIPEPGL